MLVRAGYGRRSGYLNLREVLCSAEVHRQAGRISRKFSADIAVRSSNDRDHEHAPPEPLPAKSQFRLRHQQESLNANCDGAFVRGRTNTVVIG
jgi:hypothetical protein